MATNSLRRAFVLSAVLLLVGGAGWWLFQSSAGDVDGETSIDSAGLDAGPVVNAGDVPGGPPPVAPSLTDASTVNELLSGDAAKWLAAMPRLMSMDSASLWELLSEPGIENQTIAKQLKRDILSSCLPLLHPDIDVKSDPTLPYSEGASQWCGRLLRVGDWHALSDALGRLKIDDDLVAADAEVLARVDPSLKNMESDVAVLLDKVGTALNPLEVESATRSLIYYQSASGALAKLGLRSLNPTQLSDVRHALPARYACEVANGCGPNSIWTMRFCLSRPGLRCPVGAGLDQVLRMNLSPVEYQALHNALIWLRTHRLD